MFDFDVVFVWERQAKILHYVLAVLNIFWTPGIESFRAKALLCNSAVSIVHKNSLYQNF